jgi:hypothetical protein
VACFGAILAILTVSFRKGTLEQYVVRALAEDDRNEEGVCDSLPDVKQGTFCVTMPKRIIVRFRGLTIIPRGDMEVDSECGCMLSAPPSVILRRLQAY